MKCDHIKCIIALIVITLSGLHCIFVRSYNSRYKRKQEIRNLTKPIFCFLLDGDCDFDLRQSPNNQKVAYVYDMLLEQQQQITHICCGCC